MKDGFYVLRGHEPVKATLDEWMLDFGKPFCARKVAKTERDGVTVCTTFLGMDYQWKDEGPPLLFETMIFGEGHATGEFWRSSTWEEAEKKHALACQLVWPHEEG
jgi:hypothetical protein